MEKTAVEWFVEQLPIRILNLYQDEIIKAKAMEKEQIESAWDDGIRWEGDSRVKNSEDYYNTAFKSE